MKQSPNNTQANERKDGSFPVPCAMDPAAAPELEQLLRAAAQGDPDAQFQLAELFYRNYEEGDGGEKALDEAVKWYQKAAGNGSAGAQFEIGWCYQEGRGVEEDREEAVKWFRAAAEQGCEDAIEDLRDLGCDVSEYERNMLTER